MRFSRASAVLAALACAAALVPSIADAAPKKRADAALRFAAKMSSGERARFHRGDWDHDLPVVITLDASATPSRIAELESLGARFERNRGSLLGTARRLSATIHPSSLDAVANAAGVKSVSLDGRPFSAPHPLDITRQIISADAVGRNLDDAGLPIRGKGVTVCDVDSGTDPFHPLFFRADGGLFDWTDENGNGVLDPGVDTVDLGDGPIVIRALNGVVIDRHDGMPMFGTEDDALDLKYDYLYADDNGDEERNVGPDAGFTEDTPTYGERLFVADDVDKDGKIEVGEKIVALGSSKVKAYRIGNKVYRRGENLIEAPWDDDMLHGTGATGVMVGGQPDYGTLVGMAPDADLVVATDTIGDRQVTMTNFCISEGARVVLHEYAPWVTYHLDGSSELEHLIDDTVQDGIVHINPAGNLSTSRKLYKKALDPGATTNVTLEVPPMGITYVIASFLWRDTSRPLSFVVTQPDGTPIDLGSLDNDVQLTLNGMQVAAFREDSDRGTAKVDFYAYTQSGQIPTGTWNVAVTDPSAPDAAPMTLIGYVLDEVSGWALGANFPENSSEDHLIGWPATSDHGIAVAAFTGHDFDTEAGIRAFYSGRGTRIDGQSILAISGPDNPIVSGHFDGYPLSYLIYGGTSGASPHVAGAAALYVQALDPATGTEVKQAFEDHAIVDDATGAVPNEDYGFGKLDVHAAIYGDRAPEGTAPSVVTTDVTVSVGASTLTFEVADDEDPVSSLVLEVDRDYDGEYDDVLASPSLEATFDQPGDYFLKIRATDPTGRTGQALLHVTAQTPVNDGGGGAGGGGGGDGGEEPGGGCGCVVASDSSTSIAGLFAAAFAGLSLSRRRKRK